MVAEPAFVRKSSASATLLTSKCKVSKCKTCSYIQLPLYSAARASYSMDEDKNKVYKQLGLFALKRKIEEAVLRVEMLAPAALEHEEAKRNKQEEMIWAYDLWDDPAKSDVILAKLADSAKVVDALKDLTYKVEEAKLITQLAEIDAINYGLFKQAYSSSLNVSKVLDHYEMAKLLKGPYDIEGACVVIKAGSEGHSESDFSFNILNNITVRVKTMLQCYAMSHSSIMKLDTFVEIMQSSSASVDIVPLFFENTYNLQIDDRDLNITSSSMLEEEQSGTRPSICIHHIPTGISVQSAGA
ncbi:peptide chain release factor PrfB3, chloroplastic-like [Humulus lupulus]|uniref:peptide chain release factor PrfB3, chloroplastic-like n=1 Tax=Humulus lupulus TaxID=3486 RepID=UPI002B40CACF|nr:peptide chain release factor PrfB3, chloroplastic-like [Humulus lupulus]